MRNFLDMCACNFGRRRIVGFLDTEEYLGVGPLKKHKVRFKFGAELARENDPYHLIVLRVLKKDMDRFRSAMEDLKIKMLICGHRDYEIHGEKMMDEITNFLLQEMKEKGKAQCPLGGTMHFELNG